MKGWLLAVQKELYKVSCSSAIENGKRMVSALCIILCFEALIPEHIKLTMLKDDALESILSLLILQPDLSQKRCLDYECVEQAMPLDVKKRIAEQIRSFCTQLHNRVQLSRSGWIYAIPLLHFLQGVSKPFGDPELDPDKMKWGDASLGLQSLRNSVHGANVKYVYVIIISHSIKLMY